MISITMVFGYDITNRCATTSSSLIISHHLHDLCYSNWGNGVWRTLPLLVRTPTLILVQAGSHM